MGRERTSGALVPVRWFVSASRSVSTGSQLASALGDAARALGFRYYALVQHGPLPPIHPRRIALDNYPGSWRERFVGERLDRIDPVQRACQRTLVGFAWSQLADLIALTPRQRALLEAAGEHGLGQGFTVPLHQPGEPAASCSFAVPLGDRFPAERQLEAQLVGQIGFAAAQRILGTAAPHGPGLSTRQRDCVVLVAQGKTDWEIACILGLSEETVTGYLAAARTRYGVARRTQLAVAALFDGEIGFEDVLIR